MSFGSLGINNSISNFKESQKRIWLNKGKNKLQLTALNQSLGNVYYIGELYQSNASNSINPNSKQVRLLQEGFQTIPKFSLINLIPDWNSKVNKKNFAKLIF